jgi:replication factor A1
MSEEALNPEDVHEQISDEFATDVSVADVESEIESFAQFGAMSNQELRRGVLAKLARDRGHDPGEFTGQGGDGDGGGGTVAPLTDIAEIDTADEWVTIEAEVVDDWDNDHESIAQVGLLDDGTSRIKFTAWDKSDLMLLPEGDQFRLENVITDEYNGRMSVNLNSSTEISFLDEEKDVSGNIEVGGAAVALQSGSGLIKRCPMDDCTRTLGKNDICNDHGEVDGEHDLRLKLVLDDGVQTYTCVVNDGDTIRELTGIDLEKAIDIAQDALDMEAVAEQMEPDLLAQYFTVTGVRLGDFIATDSIEKTTDHADPSDLLVKARSL